MAYWQDKPEHVNFNRSTHGDYGAVLLQSTHIFVSPLEAHKSAGFYKEKMVASPPPSMDRIDSTNERFLATLGGWGYGRRFTSTRPS
jgi:hypothetical protein